MYPLCTCAERTAVVKAASEGHTDFEAIAVVVSSNNAAYPCGSCRQVLAEFSLDMKVYIYEGKTQKIFTHTV